MVKRVLSTCRTRAGSPAKIRTWAAAHEAHVTTFHSANARVRGDELASRSPSGLARLEPALDIGRAPADAAGGESERLRQVTAAPEAPECRQTQADALG